MKKLCLIILLYVLITVMSACGSKQEAETGEQPETTEETARQNEDQTQPTDTETEGVPDGMVSVFVLKEKTAEAQDGKTVVTAYAHNDAGMIIQTRTTENGVETKKNVCTYDGENLIGQSYYKNGALSQNIIYTYNAQGWLTEHTVVRDYGSETYIKYEYYEDGTIKRQVQKEAYVDDTFDEDIKEFDERGNLVYHKDALNPGVTHQYTYNDNDQLLEELSYHNDKPIKILRRTYDEAGHILTEFADCQWEESYNRRYSYNENGELIKTEYLDMAGNEVDGYSQNIYDEKGNLVRREEIYLWDADGEYSGYHNYLYDENGNLIEESGFTSFYPHAVGGLSITCTYTYDENGRKISQLSVEDGEEMLSTWKYDEQGNVIEETRGDYTYQYTYDEAGNLIKKVYLENGAETRTETWTYQALYLTPEQAELVLKEQENIY